MNFLEYHDYQKRQLESTEKLLQWFGITLLTISIVSIIMMFIVIITH